MHIIDKSSNGQLTILQKVWIVLFGVWKSEF